MAEPDAEELIAGQYADRPALRPVLDAVLAVLPAVGEATVQPRKTCVSLLSPRRVFAVVQPTTRNRVDLGLRMVEVNPGGRLVVAKNVGSGTINLRIALTSPEDVDDEVLDWLTKAYRQSIAPAVRAPRAPRRQLGDPTSMSVVVEGHDLPGLRCHPGPEGEHNSVHVGLWTSSKDPSGVAVNDRPGRLTDVAPGDAPSVRWECTVTVGRDADGLDFVGPNVRGERTDRHLGLFWGDFDGTEFRIFRGAKLRLVDIAPEIVAAAAAPGHQLVARLGLSDAKGFPVCARRPDIEWSAEPV
ncbi:MAG TPA: DUF5990 family protein [Pseudonocardiaceae bacterium]|jgi:hypothetical protein|nr:DUF5990 family protein [Pseudonocardiaceae bacterium]